MVEGIQDLDSKGNKVTKANVRLWTKYFYTIGGIPNWSDNLDMLMNFGSCLPDEHMILFTQFIKNKLDKLPSAEEMLNKDEKVILKELENLIGKDKENRRQDLAALLLKRLVNYITVNEKTLDGKKHVERTATILDSDLFSKDLIMLVLRKVTQIKKFNNILVLPSHPNLLNKFK